MRKGLRDHRYKFFIPFAQKLVLSTSFLYRILPAWNFLPDTCFNVCTYNSFKSKVQDVDFSKVTLDVRFI